MNRLILKRSSADQTQFSISKDQSDVIKHLHDVLKVKPGDHIKVALLNEGLGKAEVLRIEPNIELKLIAPLSTSKQRELHLLIGVSRPPTVKKILEHATSMGVSHFHFFKAQLSEKSYLQSRVFEETQMNKLLSLGISQSSQLYKIPKVSLYQTLERAIEALPPQRFILSLKGTNSFNKSDLQKEKPVSLAIGPERGWTAQEEELLEQNTFKPIKISSHTLRVEIATFSALGQLEVQQGQL